LDNTVGLEPVSPVGLPAQTSNPVSITLCKHTWIIIHACLHNNRLIKMQKNKGKRHPHLVQLRSEGEDDGDYQVIAHGWKSHLLFSVVWSSWSCMLLLPEGSLRCWACWRRSASENKNDRVKGCRSWGWWLLVFLRSVQLLQWRTAGCSRCGRAVEAGMRESHGPCAWRGARGGKTTPLDFGVVVACAERATFVVAVVYSEGAGWKLLVVPLLSLLVVGDWRWWRLKEKKVRSRRESVGAGILFWQQRGKSRGCAGNGCYMA